VGQVINLDGSLSYDPDPTDSIVSWEWDLDNDGQYDDASGAVVPWTWGSPGTYIIGLRVTSDNGETDEDATIVTISRASTPGVPLMGQAAIPAGIAASGVVLYKRKRA
jgi:PKD repeat protein